MPIPGEAVGGDYNQGDTEWDQLNAQDELNNEYGDELNNIDAELEEKKQQDRAQMQETGQKTMEAATGAITPEDIAGTGESAGQQAA